MFETTLIYSKCCTISANRSCPVGRIGRQEHRYNMPADDPSTYYRRCISMPMVNLLSELHTRFSSHHRTAMLGLSLVASALVTLPADDVKSNLSELHSWTVGNCRCNSVAMSASPTLRHSLCLLTIFFQKLRCFCAFCAR